MLAHFKYSMLSIINRKGGEIRKDAPQLEVNSLSRSSSEECTHFGD